MAVNGNFQVSACRQFVEVVSCNVWVDIKFFGHLSSSDA
jgi:hypothetical protein